MKEVVAVPDIVTSSCLLWPISKDEHFRLTRVCKEDEGVSICAAMSYSNTKAILIMQQTGFMDSLNAIRAMGSDYNLPVIMFIGLQGKEPGVTFALSEVFGIKIVKSVIDAFGFEYSVLSDIADIKRIAMEINLAYSETRPHIFLLDKDLR